MGETARAMATEIEQKLTDELKDAMKSGDEVRRDAIRMLRAALKNEEIELRHPLTADEVDAVVARIAKRHRESIDEFKKGNRPDLVAHEEAQLAVVERFANVQMLSREQVEAEVRETIADLNMSGPRAMGAGHDGVVAEAARTRPTCGSSARSCAPSWPRSAGERR